MMRMVRYGLAFSLILALSLVAGCVPNRPPAVSHEVPRPDHVATLKSLHDKIVYSVGVSVGTTDTQRYRYDIYWVDPTDGKSHFLLTMKQAPIVSADSTGEVMDLDVTHERLTDYFPDRAHVILHAIVAGDTHPGSDHIANVDGTNPRRLVEAGYAQDFSPDGKHLLVGATSGPSEVALFSADWSGRVLKQLTLKPKGIVRTYDD